jgi:hypothetical protein
MILLEKKIGFTRDSVVWIDKENNRCYRRVVAGMQWPGARPGFAVIVGEEENEDPLLHENHIHVLNEIDGSQIIGRDSLGFMRRVSELHGLYGIENIYGNPNVKSMREMLHHFNETLPNKGRNGLYVEKAPLIDDPRCFDFCVQIVRKRLVESRKTLHLGKESSLPGILAAAGEVMGAKAEDYPAIAALGYAVGALDSWKPFKKRPDDMQQGQYDVFTLYAR